MKVYFDREVFMEKVLMFIVLTIVCFISQIVAIHLEVKYNISLFIKIYYDLLKDDILKEIKKDPYFYESLFYSDISEGCDKNV